MKAEFYGIPKHTDHQCGDLSAMIPTHEREALYNLCKIPMQPAQKELPLIPFAQAHRHKELLANFSGKRVNIAPNASAAAFVTEVVTTDMAPRFPLTTLLVVEPNMKPRNRGFVLVYVHELKKILLRKYVVEDDDVELQTNDDRADPLPFTYQDKIIGVVTEAKFEFKI